MILRDIFLKESISRKHFLFALKVKLKIFRLLFFIKMDNYVNVDITYIPLMNHDMQVTAVYGVAKDITM